MRWNAQLDGLDEFPFRRLARLLDGVAPGASFPVDLAMGEPQHAPPHLLAETVAAHSALWNRYPPPQGTPAFRRAVAAWLGRRYDLPATALDPERHVLPVAGTKEALFMVTQLVVPRSSERPVVLLPDPVYATYVGGAVAAGAEPVPMAADARTGELPDLEALPETLLTRAAALFLCSPANPQGAIADGTYLARAIDLARTHGFLLVADECYSEIWDVAPPPGALAVAWERHRSFENVLAMNSLSKRSNAAGLRSGFCAGDAEVIRRFLRLRAYGGAVQPLPIMAAAAALWGDEAHVEVNRARYRAKLDMAQRHLEGRLGFRRPAGGFFLWLDLTRTGLDGEAAARLLWAEAGVKVLPGAYLSPGPVATAPGRDRLRLALVQEEAAIDEALARVARALPEVLPP